MGLRGPTPKPTGVRVLEGCRAHRPLAENEPEYVPGIPVKPKKISRQAQRVWEELVDEMAPANVLRKVDQRALWQLSEDEALLSEAYAGLWKTRANGKPQCRACKVERFFSEILYPPLGYLLLDWQRKVLRDLYGTVVQGSGLRQYRHGYVSVAKQNGKSFLFGGLPIYHLLMEDELNPEAYGCAAAKDQAGIVFKAAARLVNANSDLRARLRLLESTKRILRRDGGGSYSVLSADGDVQDGIRPGLLLRDEVHRWKTARAQTLDDLTTKGQISRNEPLNLGISTAGAEYESPLWWREYESSKRVLDGSLRADSSYAAIWEANAQRIERDPDYWKSREARMAANPSHEDLGGFLKDSSIVGELEKALAQPSERSKYLRYHLNVPLKAEEDRLSTWRNGSSAVVVSICGNGPSTMLT